MPNKRVWGNKRDQRQAVKETPEKSDTHSTYPSTVFLLDWRQMLLYDSP